MDKKRMKRMIGIAIPRALIITGISYNGYIRTHTFTLSGGVVKNELIQPINNKIKVSGNADTDVIFTDIESRKQYTIGYITHGMSETIQLEKGKWYSVEGNFPRGNKQAENNHIDKFQFFRKFEVIELKKGGKFNGKSEKNH